MQTVPGSLCENSRPAQAQMKNRIFLACIVVLAGLACWYLRNLENDRGIIVYATASQLGLSAPSSSASPEASFVEELKSTESVSVDSADLSNADNAQVVAWIEYGEEFWHEGIRNAEMPHGFDAGRVIDRVSHALRFTVSGSYEMKGKTYEGRLVSEGLAFSPLSRTGQASGVAEFRSLGHQNAGAWLVRGNVAQRIIGPHSRTIEHVEFTSRGAELTWVLAEQPSSAEVSFPVETVGMDLIEITDSGLHFGGADGVARVRVSEAIAVDSAGKRLQLPLLATADGFRVDVPQAFLSDATYPVAIDPLIEPEVGIDAPDPLLAKTAQFEPAMASNGENVLVVWRDTDRVDGRDIFGARVAFDGTVIDVSGVAIATGVGDQQAPSVASDGTDYLVVWEDEIRDGDIFAARVSGDTGLLLDLEPLNLVSHSSEQSGVSVAGMPGRYLFAWQDFRNNAGPKKRGIYGIRVGSDGALLDEAPFVIADEESNQNFPSVASNGDTWLVAWHDLRDGSSFDVYGTIIDRAGEFLTPGDIWIADGPDSEWNVSATSNGNDYFVAWQNKNGGSAHDIFGIRIDASGNLIGDGPTTICVDEGDQVKPSVAAISGGYLAVWEDARNSGKFSNRDVYGIRLGVDGTPTDAETFAISIADKDQRNPVVVSAGDHFIASWEDFRNGEDNDIFGSRISLDGEPVVDPDAIWFSTIGNEQLEPAVATNGTEWLVVWADNRNGEDFDIHAARVDGTTFLPIDEGGLVISNALADQRQPAVASDGTDFLITWADFRSGTDFDIYGAKLSGADGTVTEAGKRGLIFKADKNQRFPDITASADNYFAVWQDERATANHDIYGIRVGFDGAVLDAAPMLMTVNFADQHRPRVSSNGTDFLVVWEDHRNGDDIDVYGNLYLASKFAPEDFAGVPIGVGEGDQTRPVVSNMGEEFVVAWVDGSLAKDRLFTARMTKEGELDGPEAVQLVQSTNGKAHALEIASNGFNHLLTWQLEDGEDTSVLAARLGADGAIPDGETAETLLEGEAGFQLGRIASIERDLRTVFVRPDTGGTPRTTIGATEFNVLPRLTVGTEPVVFDEGAPPELIAASIIVEDPDSENFEGGSLLIEITSGNEEEDSLSIVPSADSGIAVVGNIVSLGGNPIGIFTGGKTVDRPLEVILTGFATIDAVQVLARSVAFQNTAAPPANKRRVVRFTVSDGDDGVSNAAIKEISINTVSGPPVITLQPQSRTVSLDETVTLSVSAKGTAPLTYQWRFNDVELDGETNASLVLNDITVADAGEYQVVVRNELGSATSDVATLSFLSVDRCVTWNSVTGASYHVEGRFDEDDEWRVVSETIVASETSTQFCVPIDSQITLFKVNSGQAPPVSDPVADFVSVGITAEDGTVTLRWEADSMRLYSIHAKRDLGEDGWTLIESRVVPDGVNGRYDIDFAGGFHFFRVSQNP